MGKQTDRNAPTVPYIASGRPMRPSIAENAEPLNEQDLLWLQQPAEPKEYYEAFCAWRDQEGASSHKMFDSPPWSDNGWNSKRSGRISSVWSWSYRAWHYWRYLGSVETEELVKYRRKMARRHRDVASVAISKAVEWLANTDPAGWRPLEAARWFELAVQVQREASGATQLEMGMPGSPDQPAEDPATKPGTLADLAGIDPTVRADLAEALHRITAQAQPGD